MRCERDHALQCVRLNFHQNGAFPLGLYSRIRVTLLTSHFPYFCFPHSLFLVGTHSLRNYQNWKLPKVVMCMTLEVQWVACLFTLRTGKFRCLETERTPQPISQTPSCLISPESYGRGECPCIDGVARFGELGSLCQVNVPFCPLSLYKYIVSSLSLSELLRFHSFLLRSGRAKAYFYIMRCPRIIFRY